jgi:hypothetical protein
MSEPDSVEASLSPLLPREQSQEDRHVSYSTLRDLGAADHSASVENIPRTHATGVEYHLGLWRTIVIVISLGLLILIQGTRRCWELDKYFTLPLSFDLFR